MQDAFAIREPSVRFNEPVGSVLRQKSSVIHSISPEATVYEAIRQMSERHVGCLLVLSGGQLTGIVTERDYARKVVLQGRSSNQTQVSEIMSSPVLSVREEDTMDDAMRLMTSRKIRHLPVMRGDQVAGLLSIGDLVNWLLEAQSQKIQHLEGYIEGSYPA